MQGDKSGDTIAKKATRIAPTVSRIREERLATPPSSHPSTSALRPNSDRQHPGVRRRKSTTLSLKCQTLHDVMTATAGWNLLMHACVSGHLDLVNLLLQNREVRRALLELRVPRCRPPYSQGQHPDLAFPPLDVNHEDRAGQRAEGSWPAESCHEAIRSRLFRVNALCVAAREGCACHNLQ